MMGAFGGTAIAQVVVDAAAPLKSAALKLKLFVMLEPLPLAIITSFMGIVLVLVFFLTSPDSASLVVDTITAGGNIDAPPAQRFFGAFLRVWWRWCCFCLFSYWVIILVW